MTDRRAEFAELARRVVAPAASAADQKATMDFAVVRNLAGQGLLGAGLAARHGGLGLSAADFGLWCEAVGSWCTATRSLLTVQDMVAGAIARWGTADQRERWLPGLTSGRTIAGFCLTEPDAGSDAAAVRANLVRRDGGWALTGRKSWVSLGSAAGLFLVLARADSGLTGVVVERETGGVSVRPVGAGLLGMRAGMVADVDFADCFVPDENVVGPVGAGFSAVFATALDRGRFSVAWGCVGLAEGSLRETSRYALARRQCGAPLAEHQLVRRMVSDMVIRVRSARQLCLAAADARTRRDPSMVLETIAAKYAASSAALANATDAVQVHGANGCSAEYPVERFFRDAKVQQIIEGTDEMNQLKVCELAFREYGGVR